MSDPVIFALNSGREFAGRVAARMGLALSAVEEREFDDGEHKTRPLVSVRGRDVFIVQSLYGEPGQSCNDKLCRLLFFIGALRDAGQHALRQPFHTCVTLMQGRPHAAARSGNYSLLTSLFEAVACIVVMLDVHNVSAFQNLFRCLDGKL
ncbi:MAG: ribose-phosphate pyrophosphokinase-like domain-containing protein [Gammaproteobacteria bacterium]